VEDAGKRQLPGNARAADRWSARGGESLRTAEGWGLSRRQQAEAFCRVNRAQPTNRASGVSCTAWLGSSSGKRYININIMAFYRCISYLFVNQFWIIVFRSFL